MGLLKAAAFDMRSNKRIVTNYISDVKFLKKLIAGVLDWPLEAFLIFEFRKPNFYNLISQML